MSDDSRLREAAVRVIRDMPVGTSLAVIDSERYRWMIDNAIAEERGTEMEAALIEYKASCQARRLI